MSLLAGLFLFFSEIVSASESQKCGLENCHGVDFVCSNKPAEFCTMSIEPGDGCRKYAHCVRSAGSEGTGTCRLDSENHPGLAVCQQCFRERCSKLNNDQGPCEESCRLMAEKAEARRKKKKAGKH